MGFYIDMEMPTAPVLFCIHPDGKVFADLEGGWREYKAIPVPKHGRLIEAFALWLAQEPPMWRVVSWHRWKRRRPRFKEG